MMAKRTLVLAILLTNQVRGAQVNLKPLAEVSASSLPAVNYGDETAFALVSPRTGSKEATREAGNNLNLVGDARIPNEEHPANSHLEEISTIQFENKDGENFRSNAVEEVTIKQPSLHYEDLTRDSNGNDGIINVINKPLSLMSDNCMETTFVEIRPNKIHNQHNDDSERVIKDYSFSLDNDESDKLMGDGSNKKRDITENDDSVLLQTLADGNENREVTTTLERRQHKQDENVKRKTLQSSTVSTEQQAGAKNNTRFEKSNLTLYFTVTENVPRAGYAEEAWFETKDKTNIRFNKLPQRESYLIPTLKLEEGFYPFVFMSEFFALIYPFDFPVDLIKDIVWGQFTFPYSFLKSIKVESTFLVFVIIFACVALIVPAYLFCLVCLALLEHRPNDDDIDTGALFPEENSKCGELVGVIAMLFVLLICAVCVGSMSVSNWQAGDAVHASRNVFLCACADVAKWLASAARELIHSFVPPVDLVLQAYRDDLRNVVTLLGEPVHKAIASESGIHLVLEALNDIVIECDDLSSKISSLRDTAARAGALASTVSDRLLDLARQLDNVKKHCNGKDIPLCDTVNTNTLNLLMKFDLMLHNHQLLELRSLGVENLTRAVTSAKQQLLTLPSLISTQTSAVRDDILQHMETRREAIYSSSRVLSDIVRHLTATSVRRYDATLRRLQEYEYWRWAAMMGSTATCGIVIIFILLSIACGCGSAGNYAKVTLQISTVWLCLSSLMLWTLLAGTFLIAGHAEVYVCHALRDKQYKTLSALLDKPSPLLPNSEGVFDAMFHDFENVTIDVSVKDVLRECEHDRPAYTVFQLDRILDVNKETSYFEWAEFHRDLGRLSSVVDVGVLKEMSLDLSRILLQMLQTSNVNLAQYRLEYNGPLVGKDLPSLVDQLENVAAQVKDLSTSGRLESLASRSKRLQLTSIKLLDQLRTDIVYKLTELELQISPFRKKLNISLSHIHTAQYYIDNQGDAIAQKKVAAYSGRLISHIAGWRTHVLTSTSSQAARCRPLFNVYSAMTTLLCTRYVASLHGWWVSAFALGSLWCLTVPICVRLWRQYGAERRDVAISLSNMGHGQQDTPTTIICDATNWNAPGPPPPQNNGW